MKQTRDSSGKRQKESGVVAKAGRNAAWTALLSFPGYMWWIMPAAFIGSKILDAYLRDQGAKWYCHVLHGVFGKLDDASLIVALSGLAACTYIAAACNRLGRQAADFHQGRIPSQVFVWWGVFGVISSVAYLIAMDMTATTGEGTFFIKLPAGQKAGQIIEGCLNLTLIWVGQFYGVIGIRAALALRRTLKKVPNGPIGEDLLRASEFMMNVTFSFIVGIAALTMLFLSIESLALLAAKQLELNLAECGDFSPHPFISLKHHAGNLIGLAVLCFAPYLAFFFIIRPVLPDRVKWRLNVRLKIDSIDVEGDGGLKPPVKFELRSPRLVVVTLIELLETGSEEVGPKGKHSRPIRGRKRNE